MMYKIRLKSNPELYVKGTPMYLKYDKTGRIFQTIGNLRSFLTVVMDNDYARKNLHDWEVVELEIVIKEIKGVHEVVTPKKLFELIKR